MVFEIDEALSSSSLTEFSAYCPFVPCPKYSFIQCEMDAVMGDISGPSPGVLPFTQPPRPGGDVIMPCKFCGGVDLLIRGGSFGL